MWTMLGLSFGGSFSSATTSVVSPCSVMPSWVLPSSQLLFKNLVPQTWCSPTVVGWKLVHYNQQGVVFERIHLQLNYYNRIRNLHKYQVLVQSVMRGANFKHFPLMELLPCVGIILLSWNKYNSILCLIYTVNNNTDTAPYRHFFYVVTSSRQPNFPTLDHLVNPPLSRLCIPDGCRESVKLAQH